MALGEGREMPPQERPLCQQGCSLSVILLLAAASSARAAPIEQGWEHSAAAGHRLSSWPNAEAWSGRRLDTHGCSIPFGASNFSVITRGPAQISGKKILKALHIGGQVTSNPGSPSYNQKVRFTFLDRVQGCTRRWEPLVHSHESRRPRKH